MDDWTFTIWNVSREVTSQQISPPNSVDHDGIVQTLTNVLIKALDLRYDVVSVTCTGLDCLVMIHTNDDDWHDRI